MTRSRNRSSVFSARGTGYRHADPLRNPGVHPRKSVLRCYQHPDRNCGNTGRSVNAVPKARELVCSRGCHGRNNETDLGAARIRPRRSLGSTAPHRAGAPRVTWFCSVAAIQDPRIRNRIPRWCSSDRGRVRGTKSSNSAARSRGRARRCPFASRMKRCNAPVQGIWERDRQANDRARRQPIGNGRPSTPRSPRAKLDGIV